MTKIHTKSPAFFIVHIYICIVVFIIVTQNNLFRVSLQKMTKHCFLSEDPTFGVACSLSFCPSTASPLNMLMNICSPVVF